MILQQYAPSVESQNGAYYWSMDQLSYTKTHGQPSCQTMKSWYELLQLNHWNQLKRSKDYHCWPYWNSIQTKSRVKITYMKCSWVWTLVQILNMPWRSLRVENWKNNLSVQFHPWFHHQLKQGSLLNWFISKTTVSLGLIASKNSIKEINLSWPSAGAFITV